MANTSSTDVDPLILFLTRQKEIEQGKLQRTFLNAIARALHTFGQAKDLDGFTRLVSCLEEVLLEIRDPILRQHYCSMLRMIRAELARHDWPAAPQLKLFPRSGRYG